LKKEPNGVVERIRSLLARFSEDEETVRRLVATDARFDALCQEYREVVELLDAFKPEVERLTVLEAEVKRLGERRAWLEEELLTRIEGHEPH
jgi:FtsZ-binding cell division protein ZapB